MTEKQAALLSKKGFLKREQFANIESAMKPKIVSNRTNRAHSLTAPERIIVTKSESTTAQNVSGLVGTIRKNRVFNAQDYRNGGRLSIEFPSGTIAVDSQDNSTRPTLEQGRNALATREVIPPLFSPSKHRDRDAGKTKNIARSQSLLS